MNNEYFTEYCFIEELRIDLKKSIDSEETLNFLLNKYKMKKYVNHHSDIYTVIQDYYFLNKFIIYYYYNEYPSFISSKLNDFFKVDLFEKNQISSSFTINVILNLYFEKEGNE